MGECRAVLLLKGQVGLASLPVLTPIFHLQQSLPGPGSLSQLDIDIPVMSSTRDSTIDTAFGLRDDTGQLTIPDFPRRFHVAFTSLDEDPVLELNYTVSDANAGKALWVDDMISVESRNFYRARVPCSDGVTRFGNDVAAESSLEDLCELCPEHAKCITKALLTSDFKDSSLYTLIREKGVSRAANAYHITESDAKTIPTYTVKDEIESRIVSTLIETAKSSVFPATVAEMTRGGSRRPLITLEERKILVGVAEERWGANTCLWLSLADEEGKDRGVWNQWTTLLT